MIGRVLRLVDKVARSAASTSRRRLAVWRYPAIEIGRDVVIGAAVTLKATDGGRIVLGDRVTISNGATLVAKRGWLTIGADGFVGEGAVLVARERLEIGADALIAEHVTVRDQDHGMRDPDRPMRTQGYTTAPIIIGDDVWLGSKSVVLKGVSIGKGAVVGAGAVVTRSLPSGAIAVGVPARVIGSRPAKGSPTAPASAAG